MKVKIAKQPVDFDIDRLISMLLELDKIHHSAAPERFLLHSYEKRSQDIKSLIEQGGIFYAEQDLQILGFASVVNKNEKYWIEWLYVQPEYRSKKVATKICEAVFASFPDKDIFVSVYAFNEAAIKLYSKLLKLSSLIFMKPSS